MYAADVSAGKRAKIIELMDVIGAKNIGRQVAVSFAQQLAVALKQAQPEIDPQAFEIVSSVTDEMLSARSTELVGQLVPVYDEHFTEAELDELLAFYRSPIGRKTLETMPAVMQESMELAVKAAQSSVPKIQERVNQRLRAEGLVKEKE